MIRRLGTVVCLIVLLAQGAQGFRVDIHADITEDALANVTDPLIWKPPAAFRDLAGSIWFTRKAIFEIVDSVKAKDLCRVGENTQPTAQCKIVSNETLAGVINTTPVLGWIVKYLIIGDGELPPGQIPQEHFDRETFVEGNN